MSSPEKPKKYDSKVAKFPPGEFYSGWQETHENYRPGGYNEAFKKLFRQFVYKTLEERVRSHLNIETKKPKVLEIGSGHMQLFAELNEKDFEAFGLDVPERLGWGSRQAAARIELMPFTDETFDAVVARKVFDQSVYDQDQVAMIQDIVRVLKRGGLFISMTNMFSIDPEKFGLTYLPIEDFKKKSHRYPTSVFAMNLYKKTVTKF